MPTFRRLPKRGFSNVQFATRYGIVNIGSLEDRYEAGAHVTAQSLLEVGLLRTVRYPVKVLGDGILTKKLTVDAAMEKIQAAGGDARVVN